MLYILTRIDVIVLALGLALVLLLLTFPARAQSMCMDLGGGVVYCTAPSGSMTCVTSGSITVCNP